MKTKDLKIMKNISGRELKPGELVTDKEVAPIQVIEGEEVETKEIGEIEIVQIKRPICQTCQSPKIMARKGWMCYCDYSGLLKEQDEAHKKELEEKVDNMRFRLWKEQEEDESKLFLTFELVDNILSQLSKSI